MSGTHSVSRRLARSFGVITLVSSLILCGLVIYEFDIVLERHPVRLAWRGELLEALEYILIPLILLILPFYLASRWAIRSSLEPLGEAVRMIDAVEGHVRGFRIDLAALPSEALPFARAINNLLDRLDRTAEFHDAFAAEVAHELKTPLAILLLELERMGTPDSKRLKEDVADMNRLVGQIMLMAQADADLVSPMPRSLVSLENVATRVATRFAPIAAAQNKRIEVTERRSRMVVGNYESLVVAVRNLVENALRVTPAGGAVTLSVGPGPRIAVADGGPGLSSERLRALSRRFARGANPSSSGAGLGLAIVSKVVTTHRGSLTSDPESRSIILSFE